MDQQPRTQTDKKQYLFHVDILIEEHNNTDAQKKLHSILKSSGIVNYKIINETAPNVLETKNGYENIANLIGHFKTNNTLIRLTVIKSKGVKLSIPCRILNYDASTQHLTVYHVDEKKVYQFHLSEIDDFNVN